jgi:hypothetical protein
MVSGIEGAFVRRGLKENFRTKREQQTLQTMNRSPDKGYLETNNLTLMDGISIP